VRAVSQIFKAF